MNKGLFRATGDVVGFLNSDDTDIDETVLESVDLAFRANPEAQAVYGDIIYTSSKVPGKVVRYWRAGGSVADITRSGWVPPHPGFFARRECLVNSGGFDPSYTIAGDFDLILRLLIKENVKAVYIRKQLVNMKLGGISNRSIGAILKANKEIIRAFRKCQIRLPLSYFPAKILNRLCQFLE